MANKKTPSLRLHTTLSDDELLTRFLRLFPLKVLTQWIAPIRLYQRAFTPGIVLWYMVLQRLLQDHSLSRIVSNARSGGADRLSPPGKRLSKLLRSDSTCSFAQSRARLPLSALQQALRHSAKEIRSWVQNPLWSGLKPVLVDGTTFRVRPHGDIPQRWSPHTGGNNSHPYWCLARAVVAFCAFTGVAMDCAIGSTACSEQALLMGMMASDWADTLFIADRNFGVYSVVRATTAAKAQVLVRLTAARAKMLARSCGADLDQSLDQTILWTPSRQDQCPPNVPRIPLQGRLIAAQIRRKGFRTFQIFLFTTLMDQTACPAIVLVKLYGLRWKAELNLRHLKTDMDLDVLECKSSLMAQKEWIAGLIANNLVASVRAVACAKKSLPAGRVSFTRTRQALAEWLVGWIHRGAFRPWPKLLRRIGNFVHPTRTKARPAEPRAIRYCKRDFPKLTGSRSLARRKLAGANAKS